MSLEVKQFSNATCSYQKTTLLIFIILVLFIFFVTISHSAKLPSGIIFSYYNLYELPWTKLLRSQIWSSGSICAGTQVKRKVLI